ncbi:DUF397 domain-containing protein [Streptomyces sp. NRRL S-495]|uniref:DUF397 domain-containing protein n=1 Tax=Streptomyces sp. NRRL S-495 TaxID=1609133 RepID=UPI000B26C9F7|nr:DUF397 domain-containing protein [Streptomyces sp. NRRL S-495]
MTHPSPDASTTGPIFRKSSYSGGDDNCVEVAALLSVPAAFFRDSKDRSGPSLSFTAEAHTSFIAAVATGEFDFDLF